MRQRAVRRPPPPQQVRVVLLLVVPAGLERVDLPHRPGGRPVPVVDTGRRVAPRVQRLAKQLGVVELRRDLQRGQPPAALEAVGVDGLQAAERGGDVGAVVVQQPVWSRQRA